MQKSEGPLAYGGCLKQQISALRASPGIPSLSGFDSATRQSIQLACTVQKSGGPAAYAGCLNGQISALRDSPGIPSLSGVDGATRQSIELACIAQKSDGPVAYGSCLRAQLDIIGVQAGDAARVQPARPKRVDRKTARVSPSASSDLSQGASRKYMSARSPWQDPGLWVLLIVAFFYLTPLLWVVLSPRSRGGAKLGWFIVVLLFSWLGFAVFLIVTQSPRDRANA